MKNFVLLRIIYSRYLKLGLIYIFLFVVLSSVFGKFIYSLWLNNSYELNYFLLFLILSDSSIFIFAGAISFVNKSINKFFKISFCQFLINFAIIIVTYILFTLGYSYMSIFICNIVGSICIIIFNIFSANKLIKKLV